MVSYYLVATRNFCYLCAATDSVSVSLGKTADFSTLYGKCMVDGSEGYGWIQT